MLIDMYLIASAMTALVDLACISCTLKLGYTSLHADVVTSNEETQQFGQMCHDGVQNLLKGGCRKVQRGPEQGCRRVQEGSAYT